MDIEKEITNFKMTELGPLPEDWEVVRLGEVAKIKYGKAKPKNKGKIPVYGSGGIYDKVDKALVNYPTLIIGRKGTAGRVWLAREPCWASDTTFFLEWKRELDVSFIYYYFLFNPLSGEHAKTTLPSIQVFELEQYKIPLPPLPEQKAIARVLRTIQDAIEATERVIAAAKELKKSLMRHLFTYGPVPVAERNRVRLKQTEIGPIPEDWEVVRLGDYFNVQSGGTPSRKIKEYWENGSIPWITSSQCQDCIVNQADQFITEAGLKNSSAKLVGPNVVLVAMVGATVGKTGFLTFKATTNQNVAAIWSKESIKADSWFMFYNLQTRYHEFKKREKFSIANLTFIRNLKIPLPPIFVQQRIAQILKAVDDKIEAEEKKKEALQILFKTMLHHLMTGKIRVKY